MSRLATYVTAAAVALFVFGSSFAPASAACKKMGFLVNDYGKDGPTSDAQVLLDKHIAAWADKQGIEEYSVGKKSVKCELFIDLILFDEHTCTASATVCWGGSRQPKTQDAKAKKKSKTKTAKSKSKSKGTAKKAVAKAPSKKSTVVKTVAKKVEKVTPSNTGRVETSALPKAAVAEDAPTSSTSPAVPYAANAVIRESGDRTSRAGDVTTQQPKSKTAAVASERLAADRAAAAAERAAAAAERAAAAAQLAAEAAKQAAAAGQASRSAVVEPVKPTNTP